MAADWLAEKFGLYHSLGVVATSATVGLIMFAILGFLLYRTGMRKQ
jgi:Na+/glutamate symporter